MKLAIVLSLLLLCSSSLFAEGDSPRILPDRDVQDRLERLVDAKPTELVFYEQVIALREMCRVRGPRHILEQAAWLSSRSSDWRAFQYATWQLPVGEEYFITKTLLPYLDSVDEALCRFVDRYIATQSSEAEKDRCDGKIEGLIQFVCENRESLPQRAVQSLYWQAPSAAFLEIAAQILPGDLDTLAQLQSAQHVIDHAVWKRWRGLTREELQAALSELDKLSKFDEWWVKLYVAEMLRRHDVFRRGDILQRLRKDLNPLVAKAVDVPMHMSTSDPPYDTWKKRSEIRER